MNLASRLVLVGMGLTIIGPLSANLRISAPMAGFVLFFIGALLALAGAVGEFIRMVKRRPINPSAFVGFIPLVLGLVFFSKARSFPPINDVSTDLLDIPAFVQAGNLPENQKRDMSYPEAFKPVVRTHYGDLTSLIIGGTPDEVMAKALTVLRQRPFIAITREDKAAKEIEATSESSFFKFKDDFILRFRPMGKSTQVDMRSKSRDGKGDVGANALRIRMTLNAIQKGEW